MCAAAAPDGALGCADCGELLAFALDTAALDGAKLRATVRARRASDDPLDRSGVWRWRELLPPVPRAAVTTLREGDVPLHAAPRSAAYAGATRVAALHLGANPTASFKDGGMTVAISDARARDARVAVCASTGNTAASMAAYAARAGIAALVLVPATGISEAKVAQTLDYGATVVAIEGDFDAGLAAVRGFDPARVAVVNSVNPYRIEGQKTAAFVLLEQRGWRAPDWVIVPGGNLGNSSALGKGFREAHALGWIDRLPRIAVVQAAGAAPFARAFRDGAPLVPVQAQTSATAIKIGAPGLVEEEPGRGARLAAARCWRSTTTRSPTRARMIGRDGIGCEPASAATLAGLRALIADGTIEPRRGRRAGADRPPAQGHRLRRALPRLGRARSPTTSCAAPTRPS